MAEAKELINEILNPPKEFTPVPFWFLNDKFEKTELRRQMTDFCEKGVNAVVLHPRIGFPKELEYLSEAYFDIIGFIVETAEKLDMKIVLYDEGMYPSGSAHGLVVAFNPDFAAQGITVTDNISDGSVVADLGNGRYIVNKKTDGTIRGIHFGEDDGEVNAPKAADILNEKAVDKFIELTHERYYEHLSKYFGNTIIGFFTDEPSIVGRCRDKFFPWGHGIYEELIKQGGNIKELAGLFDNEENQTVIKYKEIVKQKLNETYYKRLHDWCENHNISLMGHPSQSDDIDEERFFHIPGQDLVFRWVSPEEGGSVGTDSVMAKCSSDAARHMGCRRNSNECFGVCSRDEIPWYFTASDMKWYIDWLGVRGVNLFIPHAFYYSVRGKRSTERPPDVGPNNIWWKHYRMFSDYIKRISYIMTDSINKAEIAVLCKSGDMKPELAKDLFENQLEFNYLPYSLLDKCEIKDGHLIIGEYEYSYVFGESDLPINLVESVEEITERKFVLSSPQRDLRMTHINKYGVDMIFAVNEGFGVIETDVAVDIGGEPVEVDLWSGKAYKTERVSLRLKPYESVLIVFVDDNSAYENKPLRKKIENIEFKLAEDDKINFVKSYVAEYLKEDEARGEYFEIQCEEMAECYVNDKLCGVSFFNHCFDIGELPEKGNNVIRLVVTGSIANKYSDKSIPYGILN